MWFKPYIHQPLEFIIVWYTGAYVSIASVLSLVLLHTEQYTSPTRRSCAFRTGQNACKISSVTGMPFIAVRIRIVKLLLCAHYYYYYFMYLNSLLLFTITPYIEMAYYYYYY